MAGCPVNGIVAHVEAIKVAAWVQGINVVSVLTFKDKHGPLSRAIDIGGAGGLECTG